jgi:hypothetical protein
MPEQGYANGRISGHLAHGARDDGGESLTAKSGGPLELLSLPHHNNSSSALRMLPMKAGISHIEQQSKLFWQLDPSVRMRTFNL